MGMRPAQRPKNKAMRSSVTACTIPATGVRPPFFTLVAVRAIAPVAGIPPNSGDAMFATPCATSSMFERWRPPIMPSATTAERSDSIAPSSAIVNAGAMSPGSCCTVIAGSLGRRSVASMAPNRVPMVSTGIWSSWTTAVVTISATNGLGTRRFRYGHHAEAEEILHLAREDDERDAAGETDGHGEGDELDRTAQAHQAEQEQDHARHQGGGGQPVHAMLLDDRVHDDDECAGRTADLDARAAQRRDEEPGHDRGEQAPLGSDAARDRERDRERQRDDADDHPRDYVGKQLVAAVPLERGDEFRDELVQVSLPVRRQQRI